ncbi:MAG: DUF1624 domain-containing protein [bacterium]|nr:DUF1624 domain-containing protein [bacterium]
MSDSGTTGSEGAVRPRRFACLDGTRAIAVGAMMFAHFGPGVFSRVPATQPFQTLLLYLSRFATPAFVTVFGVTAGFVYFEKFVAGGGAAIVQRVKRRIVLLIVCSFLIQVPEFVKLLLDLENVAPTDWLYASYSVLLYYTLGVASVPLWLRIVAPNPYPRCLMLGGAHWLVGAALANYLWPYRPDLPGLEFGRFYLVSGSYAYLQMSGTALMAMPIGIALRRCSVAGTTRTCLGKIAVLGAAATACGLLLGVLWGEFAVSDMATGALKAPPRFWYFLYFGGWTLFLMGASGWVEFTVDWVGKAAYPFGLAGQAVLPIYTAHTFVLPGVHLMEYVLPGVGKLNLAAPLVLFTLFSAAMMVRKHLQSGRKSASKPSAS